MGELDGNWITECFLTQGQGNTQSSMLTLLFDANSSVYTEYAYSDTNCSVPAIFPDTGAAVENIVIEDTLSFPEESVSTPLGDAPFINFTNGPATRYSIYRITDAQLYFGDGISDTPENRPTTIDEFFYYTRL